MYEVSDAEMLHYAKKALEYPDNYAGDGILYVTHGATLMRHRDSDVLQESNYAVALRVLKAVRDTGTDDLTPDVYEQRASHWAVGWVDTIGVRVYDAAGEFTPAWREACTLRGSLEDYPVLDDEDYSERERDAVEADWPDYWRRMRPDTLAELDETAVLDACTEFHSGCGEGPYTDGGRDVVWPYFGDFLEALREAEGDLARVNETTA